MIFQKHRFKPTKVVLCVVLFTSLATQAFSQFRSTEWWIQPTMGLGEDLNYNTSEFLGKKVSSGGFIVERSINRNQMIGFELFIDNKWINYRRVIEYVSLNPDLHSNLISATSGYHATYDLGIRHSNLFFYKKFYLKTGLSGGAHKVTQMEHSIVYFPTDTSDFTTKKFTTRPKSSGAGGWGLYFAVDCIIGLYANELGSFFIGGRFGHGESTIYNEYVEVYDGGTPSYEYYSEKITNTEWNVQIGFVIHLR